MLLHQLLERGERSWPDSVALVHDRHSITYGDLNALANRFASLYQQSGAQRHSRIIIALENGIDFVAAYMGALKAGAVAVLLPPGPRNDRLARAVAECSPIVAVLEASACQDVDDHRLDAIPNIFVSDGPRSTAPLPPRVQLLAAALDSNGGAVRPVRGIDIDLAAIVYTSGSTGDARGVMLSHRNFVANALSIVEYLKLTHVDRIMCVLPFYYVYGLSLLHTHLAVGGVVVIDNRFAYPNVVIRSMAEHGVTGLAGVPSTFAILLHRSDLSASSVPQLRYVTQAGGPLPIARIREWLARVPTIPLYVMYGATEASARLTYLDPNRLTRKMGSIGHPVPNVEILVVRDDGSLAEPGEIGELVARGSNIARGYWGDPAETGAKFSTSGYQTGDLGYADEDGDLFLVGRRHDMLKIGAHRVGAKEIEDVLCEHEAVYEAAVIGVPDDILGETPFAFVALRQPLERASEALRAHCARQLPLHKVPSRISVCNELPRIAGVGKVDKGVLRGMVTADL